MRRLALCLTVVVAALVAVPAALGDGPSYVNQGGAGATTPGGSVHWVTVSVGNTATLLERIERGQVTYWFRLKGMWGTPLIGTGQGLAANGRTLVLVSLGQPRATPSRFLVIDLRRMHVVRTIALRGTFTFDALSPDASRMYLIEYTHGREGDLTHYVVRDYDLRTNRLLPGKIAARSEDDEKTMSGYAVTRTTSVHGRWVYTLYQKPSGEPFIHALDTVRGVAYCIDLPGNKALYNVALSLRDRGRTLAVHWQSGRPWLNVAVGTWQVSYPGSGFPWAAVVGGIGGGLALVSAGALLLWRRRREEVQERPREELGLA